MSPNPEFKPLSNICEFLNALHVYATDARQGRARLVQANHYCSHVRKDLRQCLIYDSPEKDARLIGVEYMVPKHVYETFPPEEQKLWHSHEYEVKSGMLILPKPESADAKEWDRAELEAMREVVGLYGKTWHFWQVDRGDEMPMGWPELMGSLTREGQVDMEGALKGRDERFGVSYKKKAEAREGIARPGIPEGADSWWKVGEDGKEGGKESLGA